MVLLFLSELRKRWLELCLASLAIGLVVSLVVVQRSLSADSESVIHDHAHNLGDNMLVVPADMRLSDFYMFDYGSETLPQGYSERLQSSDIGRHMGLNQSRLYGNVESNGVPLILVGVDHDDLQGGSSQGSMPKAIVGGEAAGSLGLPQGGVLSLGGISLQVLRVLDRGGDGLGVSVFVSLKTAQEILKTPGSINAMHLGGCWCSLDIPDLASKVEGILPGTRAISKAGMVKAQKEMVSVMERYTWVFYAAALLMAGGVVLFLILSQVRRYMREFGLLLAIGTPPGTIVLIFAAKAGITGMLGAVIGFLLGIPLTIHLSSYLLGVPVKPSPGLLLPMVALCVLVSLATALIASTRLAFLDPTTALREV